MDLPLNFFEGLLFDNILALELTGNDWINLSDAEAVARRCSVKKVFLKISKNPQENNCVIVSFLIKLQV